MITEFTYRTNSMLGRIDRSMEISEYVESDVLTSTKRVYKYIGFTNKWSLVSVISPESELTSTMSLRITAHIRNLIWELQKKDLNLI